MVMTNSTFYNLETKDGSEIITRCLQKKKQNRNKILKKLEVSQYSEKVDMVINNSTFYSLGTKDGSEIITRC